MQDTLRQLVLRKDLLLGQALQVGPHIPEIRT